MSLLRKLLSAKPVRTPLDFGINTGVRLIAISNEEKKKDGEIIPRHIYMTFGKYNSKNELIASSEFNYFNLSPEYDNTLGNLSTEVSQLTSIVDALNPGATFDPTDGYEDLDEIEADTKTKKGCKKLQDAVWKSFNKAVGKKVGPESPLLNLKVVTDYKTGKYLQLSNDAAIVELATTDPSESVLRITVNDLKNKDKALTPITNAAPDAPGEKPTQGVAVINI
jgi:hypothetical protein